MKTSNEIIEAMGGATAVSKMCGISVSAISQWRTYKNGIPKPWLLLFKHLRPDLFPKSNGVKSITPKKQK